MPRLWGGLGKLIIGLLLTGYFLKRFAADQLSEFGSSDLLASAVLLLIIAPLWLGVYSLFRGRINSPVYSGLSLIVSSIATAAITIWVLPGLLGMVFNLLAWFSS